MVMRFRTKILSLGIAVRNHEASNRTTITDSISCILFFRQLHLGLTICYVKIATFFDQGMFGWAPLLYVDVETSKCQNRHTDVMHESRLIPPPVRWHFLALVVFSEIPVGYARKAWYEMCQLLVTRRATKSTEPRHEKTCLWGLWPELTQTSLLRDIS